MSKNKNLNETYKDIILEKEDDNSDMKNLIIDALDEAYIRLEKQIPQTKKEMKTISIGDVKPLELTKFMKDNDVPDDAYFSGRDNGYDGWEVGDIVLAWDIDVPTNEKEKLKYSKDRFRNIAWQYVYRSLTTNGYTRVGYSSGLLKQFDDTTVYDMYMDKDFDRLVKYYSLPFIKK
jgi:hypothetical protein